MNVKKTIRKLVALGTGATMVGATIMGAMADLSTYPAPFVKDGVVDTLIVVGANAKTMDTLGAIDIAASLQAVAVTPIATGNVAGTTTITGDSVEMSRGSDTLELNETIGSVRQTLTEGELNALAGGTITAGGKTTKFNQYLRFDFTDADGTQAYSGLANYYEDEDQNIGDFLKFVADAYMFEYQLEFAEGLQSDVDPATTLEDIEDEALSIFGTDYTVVDTVVGTNQDITLKLMGGEVTDTLGEGETKTYTINGADYEVTAVFISDATTQSVKFSVNGELTKELNEGDTDLVQGDMEIGVRAILTNQREGIAEFYLGANKIELRDTSFTDDNFYQGVDIGGESVTEARVKIKAQMVTDADSDGVPDLDDKISISSIYYQVYADAPDGGDIYIPPGHGLREYVEEPAALLNPTWDIKYEGLTDVEVYEVGFDAKGKDEYNLVFTNTGGLEYNIPLLEAVGTTNYLGDRNGQLFFVEGDHNVSNTTYASYMMNRRDMFVVSDRNDEAGITRVLKFDSIDSANNQILLTDMAAGSLKYTYTGTPLANGTASTAGLATFTVGTETYSLWVCGNATTGAAEYRLLVDLDGDGILSQNNTVNITTMGGLLLEPQMIVAGRLLQNRDSKATGIWQGGREGLNITTRILQKLYDENGPDNGNADETNTIEIRRSASDQVDLAVWSGGYVTLYDDPENDDWQYGMTPFGAFYKYHNPSTSTEANELFIDMPKVQRTPQVFVTAGVVTTSRTTTGGDGAVVVNPTTVGIGVLDSDVTVGQGNLIVIGGPCVNTIAQELMENPENCAEGFEPGKAVIKLYDDENALLVAGYGWEDTLGACYVLKDYAEYELAGTEMEVVVADLDSIEVNRVE
ncbi:MAG: hypothetical protein KKG59_05660 [Nanoarchaeota archaeon]|nr:hypothetical protein [Nanoarchaeota archaeon]